MWLDTLETTCSSELTVISHGCTTPSHSITPGPWCSCSLTSTIKPTSQERGSSPRRGLKEQEILPKPSRANKRRVRPWGAGSIKRMDFRTSECLGVHGDWSARFLVQFISSKMAHYENNKFCPELPGYNEEGLMFLSDGCILMACNCTSWFNGFTFSITNNITLLSSGLIYFLEA